MRFVRILFILAAAICFQPPGARSQVDCTLPVPLNIRHAYEVGTRSPDGSPGPNYWQNWADYTIRVELAPPSRLISGRETIVYHNESPDSLDELVLRLYQDVTRKGSPRDFPADPSDLHDGVVIEKLVVGGNTILPGHETAVTRKRTNLFVKLRLKLPPRDSLQVQVDWRFRLALHFAGRYGAYDSTSFFVAYWYPQVAVYDDIDGWDEFSYHGIQEFYGDFNNYDVSVTVPEGFVVWATGRLQNPEAVLTPPLLRRYRRAFRDTNLVHVIGAEDLEGQRLTETGTGHNTWRFRARNVTDFAFATSDHYLWDLIGLPAKGQPDGRILVAAAYRRDAKFLPGVAELQKRAIRYFSEILPGVSFPFPSFTLFQLRGGMEYPMMNSQGDLGDAVSHVFVATHELAHTYFPFLVGTNERKYAWMDEAWAMVLPLDLQRRELRGADVLRGLSQRFYAPFAGGEFDLPPAVPSIVYGTDCFSGYRYTHYARPMKALVVLRDMVGEERFRGALREYIRRWRGKHPVPHDFFNTFNDALGENLNWFWKPWFFEIVYPDLAVEGLTGGPDRPGVVVVNRRGLPLPVKLRIEYADGTVDTLEKPASVWKSGERKIVVPFATRKTVAKVQLGDAHIPDIDLRDNVFRPGGRP